MPIESIPIKGVERMDAVVIRNPGRQMGLPRRNLYMMDVDKGRNCYNCGGFGHLTRSCRNKGTGNRIREDRRLEYEQGNNEQSNLNRDGDLIVFN